MSASLRYVIPVAVGIAVLGVWEFAVRRFDIPVFVLPPPSAIWEVFTANFSQLLSALWVTLRITAIAFAVALASGIALAIVFSQSRIVELALYPYAVALQVTPVISIAPLILIWLHLGLHSDNVDLALLVLAWIVAFFPILSNTTVGLRSADHNLKDLFRLYGASRLQTLWRLQLPSALPFLLAAMKISGGLSLIGVIVAEFVAGSGNDTGIGWTIIEAGNRLETAKMFAALGLLSFTGISIFFALSALEYRLLHRWHESALKQTL